jgi:hypothetical protein
MKPTRLLSILAQAALGAVATAAAPRANQNAETLAWAKRELRADIIGTDTSHVPAFAETLRSRPEWNAEVALSTLRK